MKSVYPAAAMVGPTPFRSVCPGCPVTVWVLAPEPCTCASVEVNGRVYDDLHVCPKSNVDGLSWSTYTARSVVEDLTIRLGFYYFMAPSLVWSNTTCIKVEGES